MGYRTLAAAVVLQAAHDYRQSVYRLSKNPNDIVHQRQKEDVEQFFCSGWSDVMCGVRGQYILSKLRQENVRKYNRYHTFA